MEMDDCGCVGDGSMMEMDDCVLTTTFAKWFSFVVNVEIGSAGTLDADEIRVVCCARSTISRRFLFL